jgi:hypothetical protein
MTRIAIPPGRWARAAAALFLLGATLGTALDAIHTHFGATAYTRPVFFRAAWWVPFLFGAAFCIGLLRPLLERFLHRPSPIPPPRTVFIAMGFFVLAYWLSVLPLSWPVVSLLLLVVALLSWWRCDRSALGAGIALAAGIGGPTVEHLLIERGTFVHLQVLLLGVPGWLPFLYLCAAIGLCTLAKRLVDAR